MAAPEVKLKKLSDFRQQQANANRHTPRGMGMLDTAMSQDGYVAPMTATADGEIIDGSARHEVAGGRFGDDVLVVPHDGSKPVVMVRTDIPSADDPRAKRISLSANRIAQVNLDFDPSLLAELSKEIDLLPLWNESELNNLISGVSREFNHSEEWQGMPAFEQEDKGPLKTIMVHLKSEQDLAALSQILEQPLTMQTKSVWFPEKKREDLTRYKVTNES